MHKSGQEQVVTAVKARSWPRVEVRMTPIIDPRQGDVEDDASSTKQRSMASLAGDLLAEISLPKLALAWTLLIGFPGLLLGLAPLVASIWAGKVSSKASDALTGVWPALLLIAVIALGWLGARRLFRMAESSFWSLNALAVQPAYALCREGVRHLAERLLPPDLSTTRRSTVRAAAAALAGLLICGLALWLVAWMWPSTQWVGTVSDLASPWRLLFIAIANSVVLVAGYLAAAALAWGIADATMDQPRDLNVRPAPPEERRRWRIAHLSDIHAVGERYGFRIESGRSGPRGNDRLQRALARLDDIHAKHALDAILVTGDVTDAGRSAEWAEFFEALAPYPRLAERLLILPGNHDVNVVDRANPARLELPTSPKKRLREMRVISAMAAVHGARVHVVDIAPGRLGATLAETLQPHRTAIGAFADQGSLRLSWALAELWAGIFPLVCPPETDDGLGIILLNSNADTHFSFTNALGLVSARQVRAIEIVCAQYPRAYWLIALHHHMIEYPVPAKALFERIGTALINGSWFVRRLQRVAPGAVVMHGHRHIDWIGECGDLRIVSAPSPVMETTDDRATHFYVHTLASGPNRRLDLLAPQRIDIPGARPEDTQEPTPRQESHSLTVAS